MESNNKNEIKEKFKRIMLVRKIIISRIYYKMKLKYVNKESNVHKSQGDETTDKNEFQIKMELRKMKKMI